MRTLSILVIAFVLVGFSTPAAIVHSYVAGNAGNNTTAWFDGTGSQNIDFTAGGIARNDVTGSATTFTKTYTASNAASDGGRADPFLSGSPTGSVILWLRKDFSALTDSPEVIFETGGAANGFSISILEEGDIPKMLVRATSSGDALPKYRLNLQDDSTGDPEFDDSDFIQFALCFDGSTASMYAHAVADDGRRNNTNQYDSATSLSGGNLAGLFNRADGTNGVGAADGVPFGNTGGNPNDGEPYYTLVTGFTGDLAAVYVYDHKLTSQEIDDNFAGAIPEPGTVALVILGATGLISRRRGPR